MRLHGVTRRLIGIHALGWADLVVEGSFFVMQIYLTNVWRLSFSTAATFLNIWGAIYRILPLLFRILANTVFGNFTTLALSAVCSTAGLVLIAVTTGGGYICQEKGLKEECVGHAEKAFFIVGMCLLALGRAAAAASTGPFLGEQQDNNDHRGLEYGPPRPSQIMFLIFHTIVPVVTGIAFPYVKKWYLLWGVAAICTALATLVFFCNSGAYRRIPPRGNPFAGLVRVFALSAFNIRHPSPKLDDPCLHVEQGDQFSTLSATRILGFLHKAAIKVDGGHRRPCSVTEVESAKVMIRMVPVHTTYLMCGVVSSIANTYLVEQATQMKTNIGKWAEPPLQLFISVGSIPRLFFKYINYADAGHAAVGPAATATIFSIICSLAAAAIERKRLHVVRRHGVADGAKAPITAFWLILPFLFIAFADELFRGGLFDFHRKQAPESIGAYNGCLVSAVSGLGYMWGALSVYVVGKVSKTGSGKGWFQHTLNRSRLDRYYWLLAAVTTLNLLICFLVAKTYTNMRTLMEETELTAQQPQQEAQAHAQAQAQAQEQDLDL